MRCGVLLELSHARFGLLGEELADRVPHVVLRGEVAGADRQARALELGEDLGELRVARPEGGDAAGLDVAGVVHLPRDLGERAARLVAVLGGVLAVGGVEEVDVVAGRVVARRHHVEREARDAGGDRAAAARRPGRTGSRRTPRPARRARGTPSRLARTGGGCPAARRRRTAWRGGAAPRPCCPRRRARRSPRRCVAGDGALHQLAEAQVVVDEASGSSTALSEHCPAWRGASPLPSCVRRRSRRERAPRLSQPSRTYSAWSMVAARLGLSSGSFSSSHSQSTISSILSSTHEADLAVAGAAGLALLVAFLAPGLQHVAGLAACPGRRPAAPAHRDRRKRECSRNFTGTATVRLRPRHQVGAGEEVGQRLLHRLAHLLVMPQPVPRAPREEVVPRASRLRCRTRGHALTPARAAS